MQIVLGCRIAPPNPMQKSWLLPWQKSGFSDGGEVGHTLIESPLQIVELDNRILVIPLIVIDVGRV